MIVITGAAGFIASNLVGSFNIDSEYKIVLVDHFKEGPKEKNLSGKKFLDKIEREQFIKWLNVNHQLVSFVFHLGARTDTAEFDMSVLTHLNLTYSKKVWETCTKYSIPLVYASSAATYGMGELGYHDDHAIVPRLKPLNPYGESKNRFDQWVLQQKSGPPYWIGMKFFNVYGPNEYHKGRMASVVFHAYNQIKETGQMKLFRSHQTGIADGEQKRDFIYVNDVVDVMKFFYRKRPVPGLYNVGTGKARSFIDLANATFRAMKRDPDIAFADTPIDIRDKYQYFTEANMDKLFNAGYSGKFTSLEDGIRDYVRSYLVHHGYK